MRLKQKSLLWMVFALLLTPAAAWGQGVILPEPIPEVPSPQALRVDSLQVDVTITDNVATTHVTQTFRNPYDHQMEGTFVFPLPEGAVVSEFAMWIDGEKVTGELLEKDKASSAYEQIVRQVRDPALLEYVGRNAFRVRIFPIPPRSQKKVELKYSEVIPFEAGLYKYVYPLKAAQLTKQTIGSVSFGVNIASKMPIATVFSPTHQTDEYVKGPRLITVGWETGETYPDRDFVLFYGISEKEFGVSLATYRRSGEDGYFLLLISPKREVAEEDVLPKDVVFVFDKSGSMSGEKISQAKAALKFCLSGLNDRDRFGLITFSTDVSLFRSSLVEAGADNTRDAKELLEGLNAEGGTNINDALLQALKMVGHARLAGQLRPAMIVFLTDGLPTVGETDIEKILDDVTESNDFDGRKVRLFVFGVGNDVNTRLLDGLAARNKGVSQYVREGEDIEVAVSSFFTKVSRPVLSDLKLDFGAVEALKMYPREIPDLFAGSTLTVFGRYEGQGEAKITLTGETDSGAEPKTIKYEYPVKFPRREKENDFLPRLWASRRIGYLLDEIRRHGESDELKDEVVELSLKNGIMTPYTSYLVLEKDSALRSEFARLSRAQAESASTRPPSSAVGAVRYGAYGGYADRARDDYGYGDYGGYGGYADTAGRPAPPPTPAGPQGAPGTSASGPGNTIAFELKSDTGAGAVAASAEVQAMKGTEQVPLDQRAFDVANTMNLARLQNDGKAPKEALALQEVGEKTFVQIDSTWLDLEAQNQEGAEVLQIQYLSDAYFEALTVVPDLGQYFAQGEKVTVRLGNLIIQTGEPQEGGQTLTDAEREKLKGIQP